MNHGSGLCYVRESRLKRHLPTSWTPASSPIRSAGAGGGQQSLDRLPGTNVGVGGGSRFCIREHLLHLPVVHSRRCPLQFLRFLWGEYGLLVEILMVSPMRPSVDPTDFCKWRALYLAALFETDRQKLPLCIATAELAMGQRARELFVASEGGDEEREGLQEAVYALRALRHCLELKTYECADR